MSAEDPGDSPEERYYPLACQSMYCGRLLCPDGCIHLPALRVFNEWKARTKAERPDPIWSPTYWRAGGN